MSNFTFENQGTNTYLVYQVGEKDTVDSMSLGMITNNKIPGLATAMFTQMDATKYIKYNVSSRVSVKQFFSGAVNKKRLLGVFSGIVNALLSAEDYMIDERTIILDLDYIFADVSSCDTVLICLPIEKMAENHDLGAFFKGIMFGTQFDQTENCDHVAHIINYLNSTPMFSLVDFKNLLEKEEAVASSVPVATPVVQKPVFDSQAQPKVQTPPASQPVVSESKPMQTPSVQQKSAVQTSPANVNVSNIAPATQQDTAPEKKISMLNLLMHYSKENAELYKQQKAAKKSGSTVVSTQSQKSSSQQKQQTNSQFAVPGPELAQGFAIPGQAAPAVQAIASQKSAQQSAQTQPQAAKPATSVPAQQPAYVPRQAPQGQAMNFGETTVLGGGTIGETTVLSAANNPAQMVVPHLIRAKNNEKISLNKPVFRVGKERSYVDYFIGDNTAISRSHANFIIREGEYFVVDTNSTNHTFVNGVMIQSNQETRLAHGDTVRLANEDFEFRLY